MAGKKYVFIIPGFRHKPSLKGYQQIKKILRKEGFTPVPMSIPWKEKTISETTQFFLEKYHKTLLKKSIHPSHVYFLGFSFGAMVAFLAATKIHVQGLILCSLSPFFKEDLPKNLPDNSSYLQLKRFTDFSGLKSFTLAKKLKAKKIWMLYGTKESRPLIRRVTATFKKITTKNKFLLPIPATYHNIADKKYVFAIHHVAKELL